MAFEQLDANGIQQIWLQDTKLDTPPVLITEGLGGAGLGNGHSLLPRLATMARSSPSLFCLELSGRRSE